MRFLCFDYIVSLWIGEKQLSSIVMIAVVAAVATAALFALLIALFILCWRCLVVYRRRIRYTPVPVAYNDENNDESTPLLESGSSVPVFGDQHPRPMEDFAAASDDKAGS